MWNGSACGPRPLTVRGIIAYLLFPVKWLYGPILISSKHFFIWKKHSSFFGIGNHLEDVFPGTKRFLCSGLLKYKSYLGEETKFQLLIGEKFSSGRGFNYFCWEQLSTGLNIIIWVLSEKFFSIFCFNSDDWPIYLSWAIFYCKCV
jgi:hypothetical protein